MTIFDSLKYPIDDDIATGWMVRQTLPKHFRDQWIKLLVDYRWTDYSGESFIDWQDRIKRNHKDLCKRMKEYILNYEESV